MIELKEHTDEALLTAIQNSDAEAFSEFVKRYWKRTYQIAFAKIRSHDVTEEVVQDLFANLWSKRESLSISNVYAYIQTIIRNRSISYIRSKIVREKYWHYYKAFIPRQEESTELAVEFNELMNAVEKCAELLPEKSRDVFRLSRLEGISKKEIASRLNLSEKSIEYHLTKSIKAMRLALKDFAPVLLAVVLGV